MITGNELEYLCAILNSSLYQKYFSIIQSSGSYNYGSATSFKKIPILELDPLSKDKIIIMINDFKQNKMSKAELCSEVDSIIDSYFDLL